MALTVTLLGGESSGKTTLAQALQPLLLAQGLSCVLVPEQLRTWCEQQGRAPLAHEQADRAQAQSHAIASAALAPATQVVLADTTALVIAAYSELYFDDMALLPGARDWQRRVDLTLLMGLDLPWVPDGFFRDSEAVRDATDAVLRRELLLAGISFQTIYGQGTARLEQALRILGRALGQDLVTPNADWPKGRRPWACEKCSDPDCEHRLFTALLARDTTGAPRT